MATPTTTNTGTSTARRDPVPLRFDYVRDPAEIYRRSFAAVRAETDLSDLPEPLHPMALRLVHACGQPEIAADLAWGGDPSGAGRSALERGAPIIVDSTMVAAGITRARLPGGNEVLCTLDAPGVADAARASAGTRSAAAVDLWPPRLADAVVAIGNAPTALFRLLEGLAEGWPPPAVVLAFPVGFVGAAESKAALIADGGGIPFLTLRGRRGGSAMAAAAVNALGAPP